MQTWKVEAAERYKTAISRLATEKWQDGVRGEVFVVLDIRRPSIERMPSELQYDALSLIMDMIADLGLRLLSHGYSKLGKEIVEAINDIDREVEYGE